VITHGSFDDLYVQILWVREMGFRVAFEQSPETDNGCEGCLFTQVPREVLNMVGAYLSLQMSVQ
jgi:hypothetical protein